MARTRSYMEQRSTSAACAAEASSSCSPSRTLPTRTWAPQRALGWAQAAEAAELAAGEALDLPPDLDYGAVQLSAEDAEKLAAARPANLAAAQRIPGACAGTSW